MKNSKLISPELGVLLSLNFQNIFMTQYTNPNFPVLSMLSGRRASVDELKDFLKKMDMSIALGRQES